jgi:hypothetical protein
VVKSLEITELQDHTALQVGIFATMTTPNFRMALQDVENLGLHPFPETSY